MDEAKVERWHRDGGDSAALAGGRGGRRSSATSWLGGDGASSGGTGLGEEGRASARCSAGGLCGSGTAKVASAGLVAAGLGGVVGIEGKGELLLGIAHAIGTIGTGGGVVGNAGAVLLAVSADLAEEVGVLVLIKVVGDGARQGAQHARAELRVSSWGKRSGLGLPGSVNAWAVSGGSVGWVVAGRVDTGDGNLGDLAGQTAEVGESGDRVARDADETCVKCLATCFICNGVVE